MTTIDPKAPVLVTGASGYIASWIVRLLLESGRTVHGTVRDPAKPKGLEHLRALECAHPGRLKLFKADLEVRGSFDDAMQDCQLVMHTASPFVLHDICDPEAQLVRPAVEGTRNVLETANRVSAVRRVVLTSSIAAIHGDNCEAEGVSGGTFTEEHWNTSSSLSHQPYYYSKACAEREAWEIQRRQSRWDLVVINPGMVLGPSLASASVSGSLAVMKQLVDGTMYPAAPELWIGIADVRDVALAHIRAGDIPSAEGRHIISGTDARPLDLGRMLRKRFGGAYRFPRFKAPKFAAWLIAPMVGLTREYIRRNVGYRVKFDNSKSRRALGLEYRPVEETVCEHFQQMLDDGVVRRRGARAAS